MGNLANLDIAVPRRNQLSGEIPPELGSLISLTWLDLGGNQLTGEIPPELGNLANLELLSASKTLTLVNKAEPEPGHKNEMLE